MVGSDHLNHPIPSAIAISMATHFFVVVVETFDDDIDRCNPHYFCNCGVDSE